MTIRTTLGRTTAGLLLAFSGAVFAQGAGSPGSSPAPLRTPGPGAGSMTVPPASAGGTDSSSIPNKTNPTVDPAPAIPANPGTLGERRREPSRELRDGPSPGPMNAPGSRTPATPGQPDKSNRG